GLEHRRGRRPAERAHHVGPGVHGAPPDAAVAGGLQGHGVVDRVQRAVLRAHGSSMVSVREAAGGGRRRGPPYPGGPARKAELLWCWTIDLAGAGGIT